MCILLCTAAEYLCTLMLYTYMNTYVYCCCILMCILTYTAAVYLCVYLCTLLLCTYVYYCWILMYPDAVYLCEYLCTLLLCTYMNTYVHCCCGLMCILMYTAAVYLCTLLLCTYMYSYVYCCYILIYISILIHIYVSFCHQCLALNRYLNKRALFSFPFCSPLWHYLLSVFIVYIGVTIFIPCFLLHTVSANSHPYSWLQSRPVFWWLPICVTSLYLSSE